MTIDELMARAVAEHTRREIAMVESVDMVADPMIPRADACEAMNRAHVRRWPAMVRTVFGRPEVVDTYRRLLRTAMDGSATTDRRIAAAVGIDESSYRRSGWKQVYAWTISELESIGNEENEVAC